MNKLISWFAENDIAANLLMVVLLVGGLLTAPRIKQEVFPVVATDRVVVSVAYPGASPEEVEQSVTRRIEERLAGIEGVKKITSSSVENASAVTVEALEGTDVRSLLDDVKNEIDGIDSFPVDIDEPIIREVLVSDLAISVAVSGAVDEYQLKSIGERVRDELSALPGISQVELVNTRDYEIAIEISEEALKRHGITFATVAAAVRGSSLDLPSGLIRSNGGEILLRTQSQAYTGRQFEDVTVLTRSDGTRLRIADVATVTDGFVDSDQFARFDGEPCVLVQVFRVGNQSAVAIARSVKDYIHEAEGRLPNEISLTPWRDRAQILADRLGTLRRNGIQGLCLVFLTLALFLQFRLAFWVSLGIPLSFLGAVWLFPTLDVSINVLSLFSLILVLGIVVDDAIVVGESVFKERESGNKGLNAAIVGTQDVAVPVIFGVLTTIAVFVPMLWIPGTTGRIMRIFPAVVIPTLIFSLIESQIILPAHLKHAVVKSERRNVVSGLWKRIQTFCTQSLATFIEKVYRPTLHQALTWRYLVASISLGLILITGSMVAAGWVRISFFPNAEADVVGAAITMPQGTPAHVTAKAVAKLEKSAALLNEELSRAHPDKPAILHSMAAIGRQPFKQVTQSHGGRTAAAFSGGHLGEVTLQLAGADDRDVNSAGIAERWREITEAIPDVVELTFTGSLFDSGSPIDIQLASTDFEQLTSAADRLKIELANYPGVVDVTDSFRVGKKELVLTVTAEGEALGITQLALARQVRQAFYGEEVQRVQRGREDLKVMVRYPESSRRSLASLDQMHVRAPDGTEVPFARVATARFARGYATIQRADRRRIVHVTADVAAGKANANEVIGDFTKHGTGRTGLGLPGT